MSSYVLPIFTLTGYPFRFEIFESDTASDVTARMIRDCDYIHKEVEKFETLDSIRILETTYRTDGSFNSSQLVPNSQVFFKDILNLYLSDNLEKPGRRNRLQLVCTNHKFNVKFDLKTCMFLGVPNINESIDFYGYPGITTKNLVCMIRNMLGLGDERFTLYMQHHKEREKITIPELVPLMEHATLSPNIGQLYYRPKDESIVNIHVRPTLAGFLNVIDDCSKMPKQVWLELRGNTVFASNEEWKITLSRAASIYYIGRSLLSLRLTSEEGKSYILSSDSRAEIEQWFLCIRKSASVFAG